MAEVYLLVAIHFVIVASICGTFGYYFHKMHVENKIAEIEIRGAEYRTTHMTADALKEIINR